MLQQIEDFADGTVSANDCFRPVSRYFDRIVHPSQLLSALPQAVRVLTDAALCGPVTLALPQDVQAMAYDYPEDFFASPLVTFDAAPPAEHAIAQATKILRDAKRPLVVAGGGVLYGLAGGALRAFAGAHRIPVAETQAGKGALPWDHPLQLGAIGVTGSPAANALAAEADVVLAVGHAAVRLHHRLAFAVRAGEARESQRQRVRCAQVARRSRWSATRRSACRRCASCCDGWRAKRRGRTARAAPPSLGAPISRG